MIFIQETFNNLMTMDTTFLNYVSFLWCIVALYVYIVLVPNAQECSRMRILYANLNCFFFAPTSRILPTYSEFKSPKAKGLRTISI